MTNRVFEDAHSWEISGDGGEIEVYVAPPKTNDQTQGEVIITAKEEAGWDSQWVGFTMTAEEATMLKEFLIRKGY